MEIHFFGHGKVMENHCWKRVVTLLVALYGDCAARKRLWCLSAETKSLFSVRCLFVVICWCGAYWCILFCRTIQDPSSQILKWRAAPKTVLVIKKIWDDVVDEPFVQLASWLVQVSQGYWPTILKFAILKVGLELGLGLEVSGALE